MVTSSVSPERADTIVPNPAALPASSAARVSVTVHREEGQLVVEVVDDGRGFDPSAGAAEGHFGLRTLEGLVRESGGTLEVESTPGEGTTLRMEVPAR